MSTLNKFENNSYWPRIQFHQSSAQPKVEMSADFLWGTTWTVPFILESKNDQKYRKNSDRWISSIFKIVFSVSSDQDLLIERLIKI